MKFDKLDKKMRVFETAHDNLRFAENLYRRHDKD